METNFKLTNIVREKFHKLLSILSIVCVFHSYQLVIFVLLSIQYSARADNSWLCSQHGFILDVDMSKGYSHLKESQHTQYGSPCMTMKLGEIE